jgi:pyroglutamyl-peptidase
MKTILLTGFEPFAGEPLNASWELARRLDGTRLDDGSRVVSVQLPCVFGSASRVLAEHLDSLQPHMVIALGQASSSADVRLERVAINLDEAAVADNAGQQPIDAPIIVGGATAYFSSLPIRAMASALRAKGIPASISYSAGTYVCNHVFYGLMHEARSRPGLTRAGFVHVPYLPVQAARHPAAPSMSLETLESALHLMLDVAQASQGDTFAAEGASA